MTRCLLVLAALVACDARGPATDPCGDAYALEPRRTLLDLLRVHVVSGLDVEDRIRELTLQICRDESERKIVRTAKLDDLYDLRHVEDWASIGACGQIYLRDGSYTCGLPWIMLGTCNLPPGTIDR